MFTKEAIALVKPCYEAIKKIAGKMERRCRRCEGIGYKKGNPTHKCSACNGTGKVKGKWEWEPKWRDLILTPTGVWMFDYKDEKHDELHLRNNKQEDSYIHGDEIGRHSFPLLHWERIEEILEGVGYVLEFVPPEFTDGFAIYVNLRNKKTGHYHTGRGGTRQEAIQRAVIEWGKEG